MKKIMLIAAVCCSFAARSDGPVDESSVAAMFKAIKKEQEQMRDEMQEQMREAWREEIQEQMREQVKHLEDKMVKKDETIAALTTALNAKMQHRQVQLTAGGEVMQLVSEADLNELTARVSACEKTNADQDAKLGMTMDTLSKVRKEVKDGRAVAPPALPPSPPPPLPPPRPVPVATPGRRLQSSSNGNERYPPPSLPPPTPPPSPPPPLGTANELSITGPNAVVSWNSRTPGLKSFNCTGVGDGNLKCSGAVRAADFVTVDGTSIRDLAMELSQQQQKLQDLSSTPPSSSLASAMAATFIASIGTGLSKSYLPVGIGACRTSTGTWPSYYGSFTTALQAAQACDAEPSCSGIGAWAAVWQVFCQTQAAQGDCYSAGSGDGAVVGGFGAGISEWSHVLPCWVVFQGPSPKSCTTAISSQGPELCNDASLTSGFSPSKAACQASCEASLSCMFFSYWDTTWCQTSATCNGRAQQPEYKIDIVGCN